jgi:heme/copper-type cytochrome/quinol oxidase subunit 2
MTRLKKRIFDIIITIAIGMFSGFAACLIFIYKYLQYANNELISINEKLDSLLTIIQELIKNK